MKKPLIAISLFFGLATLSYGQSGLNGTWTTTDFGDPKPILDFKVEGAKLTGTISRPGIDVNTINEGHVSGGTITFTISVADGGRINSYTGKLNGDTIAFTRSVKVRDDAANIGATIYGAKGPMQFTAKRDTSGDTGLVAFYGNWKVNLMKSKFEPGPPPKPIVPEIDQFSAAGEGKVELFVIVVNELGNSLFLESLFKTDGKEYPVYGRGQVASLLVGEKPTLFTMAAKLIEARTVETTFRVNNAVTEVDLMTLSPDGKTITDTEKYMDAQGKQRAKTIFIFDSIQ